MSRLGIRRRLLVAVVVAVTLGLGALIAGFNLLLAHDLDRNADNAVRSRASAELSLLHPRGDRVVVGEAPDDASPDAGVWVFSRGRLLEAPRVSDAATEAARRAARRPLRYMDAQGPDLRFYAVPAVFQGRRLATVVAAVSLAPYEQSRRTALIASLAFGLIVLAGVAIAARWLLASALRPVTRMTRDAAAWSDRDLDRRFGLGHPHDELGELAATLDGLLDRLAASLRREQRFSAELSHELRTPLARVITESELALRRERSSAEYRESFAVVLRSAQQLARTVDALLAAARYEAGATRGRSDAYEVACSAVAACADLAAERGVEVVVEPPPRPLRLGVDLELAERILHPVVDNACRYGHSNAVISIARQNGSVSFTVDDDGVGVPAEEAERIFEPGVRGSAASAADGAGLGLALARRLARSVSGEVAVIRGTSFEVRLPTA